MSYGCDFWFWRMALAEADLSFSAFQQLGLPVPDVCDFKDHTTERFHSTGAQFLAGYATAEILWNVLTGPQLATIYTTVESAKSGSGILYMTIDLGDGRVSARAWADISARPARPITTQSGPISGKIRGSLPHYENVSLALNNVTVINEPSVYSV